MLSTCERQLLFFYLSNAASHLKHTCKPAGLLAEWVAENRSLLGLDGKSEEPGKHRRDPYLEKDLSAREWRRLREILNRCRRELGKDPPKDRTGRRLRYLGGKMVLTPEDLAILEILLRYRTFPVIEHLVRSVFESDPWFPGLSFFNVKSLFLPRVLGISASALRARFAPDAPLVKSGLVTIDEDGDFRIIERLYRLVSVQDCDDLDVRRLLLDAAAPGELEWSDFDHVAEERDHIEKVLKGALASGTKGVNVLVYGPPGTGKTEFCKTLASRLGANLYSIGEANDEGDEPNRHERLQDLRLAQRLLAPSRPQDLQLALPLLAPLAPGGSVLLFDEMEDLLGNPGSGWFPFSPRSHPHLRSGGSKVFMNRLLERAPVPTLWTSNSARETCPTILRRMTFALELRQPTPRVRARIWMRELARHGIEATEENTRSLARDFEVSPGVASGAVAAALLCGGDLETVRRGVRSLSKVMAGEKPLADQGTPERFDPALTRADIDPVEFADRLAEKGGKRFSICLQGPPGTGKSAFVRYLAERLGLEVTQKRASDLISMWVGETEQQIAAAFAEARAEGSLLVFDEADSLLADRRRAVRSWEISQVNEMLTWMESHPLPFACTTNFGENLDPATLRRFTFKIALDYLTSDQSQAAFRTYFGIEAPDAVEDLTNLTPGDFAVVLRKAEILGHLQDPEALAELLRTECEAKPNHARRVGF